MTRNIKTINKGENLKFETITIESSIVSPGQSIEAYADMVNTIKSALDYGLLRNTKNAPDRVVVTHNGTHWVIKAETTYEDTNVVE